ncbi:hypothetical protein ACQKFK_20575 [Bacillus mycoides]|uniref:hypothetical protein n=1 Tax=Bacillus mycoides TaxID=1405 RepID=UPI003D05D2E5
MSSNNFLPAVTSIKLYTQKDSPNLALYKGQNNILHISCKVDGIIQRSIPFIHETIDYTALYFTLYHQFGGRDTTIVRRYLVEYAPQNIQNKSDTDYIELQIPIDDDFSEIDFVSNYYFLQINFTYKHPSEMGIIASLYANQIFNTKIPFIIQGEI